MINFPNSITMTNSKHKRKFYQIIFTQAYQILGITPDPNNMVKLFARSESKDGKGSLLELAAGFVDGDPNNDTIIFNDTQQSISKKEYTVKDVAQDMPHVDPDCEPFVCHLFFVIISPYNNIPIL